MRFLQSTKQAGVALALATLLLSGCGGDDEASVTTPGTGTVNFIELNDLHAHIVPHTQQVRSGDEILLSTRGGIARIKSKIDELSGSGSIVMNIGDTFHGGAEALFSNGNDIVELMNELPIDVAVMGNWDFAYGAPLTTARFGNTSDANVLRPNFEYLGANTKYMIPLGVQNNPAMTDGQKALAAATLQKVYKYTAGDEFLSPTKMIEKNGVKVGVIGITSDIVNRMSPLLAPIIEFTQGEAEYVKLIEYYSDELKAQGAHIVVLMSELGIHKDVQLANKIKNNSVNVFFSAHTHEATFAMIDSTSGAKVVESGDDTYLGEMKVSVVDGNVTNYEWKLHEITNDIVPDANVLAKVQSIRAKYLDDNVSIVTNTITPNVQDADLTGPQTQMAANLFRFSPQAITLTAPLDKVIGTTTLSLTRKNVLENGFNAVFAKLLKNSYNTDMALVPGFRYDDAIIPEKSNYTGVNTYNWTKEVDVVLNGEVSIENIYRYLPSTNYVAQGSITGANLKTLVETEFTSAFSKDAFEQAGGWVPGFAGLKIQLDMSQENGFRLLSLSNTQDVAIADDAVLSVASACARPLETSPAVASTTLCGRALFTGVVQDKTLTTANFLIDAFMHNLDENLSDEKRVNDISGELLWPQSEFVQPILK